MKADSVDLAQAALIAAIEAGISVDARRHLLDELHVQLRKRAAGQGPDVSKIDRQARASMRATERVRGMLNVPPRDLATVFDEIREMLAVGAIARGTETQPCAWTRARSPGSIDMFEAMTCKKPSTAELEEAKRMSAQDAIAEGRSSRRCTFARPLRRPSGAPGG